MQVTGYDKESLKLTVRYFWHRLIGTAGGWFCNDFFFYGNKIFQGAFLACVPVTVSRELVRDSRYD